MENNRIPYRVGINKHVYYGTCATEASVTNKQVVIQNPTLYTEDVGGVTQYFLDLSEGDQLIISFSEKNTATNPNFVLRVSDLQDDIGTYITSGRIIVDGLRGPFLIDYWEAGDVITFTYAVNISNNTGYWVINNYGPASENRYGTVKLADSNDANVNETDENTAASIPRIQQMIDNNMQNLSLAWGNTWGNLTLHYKGRTLTTEGSLDGISVPTSTVQLVNEGPKGVTGTNRYIYKSGTTINEPNTNLNIGVINTNNKGIYCGVLYSSYINTGGYNLSTENLDTHTKGNIIGGAIDCTSLNTNSGSITSGGVTCTSLNTTNGTITCGAITSKGINTQNSSINAGTGTITCAAITSKGINTQNSNINAGTGTITCGAITASGNITASGKTITAGTMTATTGNFTNLNIGNTAINDYVNSRATTIANARKVSFTTKLYYMDVFCTQFKPMRVLGPIKDGEVLPRIDESATSQVWLDVTYTGWTILGVTGFACGKIPDNSYHGYKSIACFNGPHLQDCYVDGNTLKVTPQAVGTSGAGMRINVWVTYYKYGA